MPTRTIKVSDALHQRLTMIASQENTTLTGAIEYLLDVAEEARFWAEVERTMTSADLKQDAELISRWHDCLELEGRASYGDV